jgi:hypothetical protein
VARKCTNISSVCSAGVLLLSHLNCCNMSLTRAGLPKVGDEVKHVRILRWMRQKYLTEVNANIPVFWDVMLRCLAGRADVSSTVVKVKFAL